jgi:hypothetical protein
VRPWLDTLAALGPTLVALVTAAIAAGLLARQAATARARLRLDLFDKRFLYFNDVKGFIDLVAARGRPDPDQLYGFQRRMVGVEFLFGPEAADLVDQVRDLGHDILKLSEEVDALPAGEERSAKLARLAKARGELDDLADELDRIFRPYLDFTRL